MLTGAALVLDPVTATVAKLVVPVTDKDTNSGSAYATPLAIEFDIIFLKN
jgi:hypothetical protein